MILKKISALAAAALLIMTATLSGCSKPEQGYTKYSDTFYDTFDTVVQIIGYTRTEAEFKGWVEKAHARFRELNDLYDIYNDYEGLNNAKTINDNAGKAPVKVAKEMIDLIKLSKERNSQISGSVNIALGPVLKIWHKYREAGIADPESAALPDMNDLVEANKHIDINKVIVDEAAGTVFLTDPQASLDLGAVAKGYATELVAEELQAQGFTSGIISGGGNVRVIGKPLDGIREKWGIGLQDPDKNAAIPDSGELDIVYVRDRSVVTSGDYQRFYVVDGKRYNHIIDPQTLLPATHFRAVSIVCDDSGLADFLSTTLFVLPYEQGRALVESLDGVEALWVFDGNELKYTDGMKSIMKNLGGATYK